MKRSAILFVTVLMLLTSALSEGLLPSLEDVYGVEIPSLCDILNRYPDAITEMDNGDIEESFFLVSEAEYVKFGEKLSDKDCIIVENSVQDEVFSATIEKRGKKFSFVYDTKNQTVIIVYHNGTFDPVVREAERKYNEAQALIENKEYNEAYELLMSVHGYKDADSILDRNPYLHLVLLAREAYIKEFSVGNQIQFGLYEQDGDTSNGAEPIVWHVIDAEGNKRMLITMQGIEYLPYNDTLRGTSWEACSLREWLNSNFIVTAFNETEQGVIINTSLTNKAAKVPSLLQYNYEIASEFKASDGNSTSDKVFLLSRDEAASYYGEYGSEGSSQAKLFIPSYPTDYAVQQGAERGKVSWWLRTIGKRQNTAMTYNKAGLGGYETTVDSKNCVRPVIWIDVEEYAKNADSSVVMPFAPPMSEDEEEEIIKGVNTPEEWYERAVGFYNEGKYGEAQVRFSKAGWDYKDSADYLKKIGSKYSGRIQVGYDHIVGLNSNGTVVATGDNDYGQCDVNNWSDIVAITAEDFHTIGLKANGTVVVAGEFDDSYYSSDESSPQKNKFTVNISKVLKWKSIKAVASDIDAIVGLKEDGSVVVEGSNRYGNYKAKDWKDIVAIDAGGCTIVGLKTDGTVVAAGDNEDGQCRVSSWKDIISISVGSSHTVGLKSDGTVVATGWNNHGQCNVKEWDNIIAVAARMYHTVGLKADGTVVVTGDHTSYKEVDEWTDIIAIAAGTYSTIGLKADGTIVCSGEKWNLSVNIDENNPDGSPLEIPSGYATLSKGAKGENVRKLQEALINAGLLNGKADGDFGNKTQEAVKAAQKKFGLEQTGIADTALQKLLFEE